MKSGTTHKDTSLQINFICKKAASQAVFAAAAGLAVSFGSSAKAEIACLWLTQCDETGKCEKLADETHAPGTFIVRNSAFDTLYRYEQDKGTIIVQDNQPESDALSDDVIFLSKVDDSFAYFGQKDNRFEMLSIGADGTATHSLHYYQTGGALHAYGTCTGQL